jgi:hypothetical protein
MAPALECISVMLGDSPDVQNQFVQAIESRSQSGRLKSVKVHILEKFAPNILERIKLLRAQGMEFTVFDNGYFFF